MLETKKYVLTVEGETEQLYFLWLRDKINEIESRKYNVSIIPKVQQSPRSFYKSTNAKITPEAFHICDVESTSKEHIDKFENILKEMSEAKKQKNIRYQLGYSNFTFELWIALHKRDCFGSLTDRKQYLTFIQQCFNEKFISLEQYKNEQTFKRCLTKLSIDDVKSAVKRAEKIAYQNAKDNKQLIKYSGYTYHRDNPSLSINEIVKKILSETGTL